MNKYLIKNFANICFCRPIVLVCVIGTILSGCNKKSPETITNENMVEKKIPVEQNKIMEEKKSVTTPQIVIKSTLAGSWYPADTSELKSQIEGLFQQAQAQPVKDVIALISPHAGYVYSGKLATAGLKTVNKEYQRIVVIGPSHRFPIVDELVVPKATHFETPLGKVPLDVEFIEDLLKYSVFQSMPRVHEYEHSAQIQLPLLQYKFKEFKFVPIVAGDCSLETIQKAAAVLKSLVGPETLVIASSDFVHYGPNYDFVPFKENIPQQIKNLDMGAYKYIAGLDAKGFLDYRQKTGATICGFVPIAVLISMMDETAKAQLIDYATSGQLTGDFENSVSYLAVTFSGQWKKAAAVEPQSVSTELTDNDKKVLLTLARKTIVYYLNNKKAPQPADLGISITEVMKSPRAVFVTLTKNSDLRGCIGDIIPRQPLYKSVISNAINSAVNDPRFPPVSISECNDITIEISALTVPQPIPSKDAIRIGIDGVILDKGGRSAVFLPQVAPEQGWDVNTMLTHLSLKAGLDADAWKEGAGFLTFQAVVFGEIEK